MASAVGSAPPPFQLHNDDGHTHTVDDRMDRTEI